MKMKILRECNPVDDYDLAIGSCGYESRGSYIFRDYLKIDLKCSFIVIRFPKSNLFSDELNESFYERMNSRFKPYDSETLEQDLIDEYVGTVRDGSKVIVDISTMTRRHIGVVLDSLERFIYLKKFNIRVDFYYSVATYNPPPKEFGSVKFKGPVTSRFGGWRVDTNIPNSAVFGVGFEPDVCLGLIEDIEPKEIAVFIPKGSDQKYDVSLRKANMWIFSDLPEEKIFTYKINDPVFLYESLMSYLLGTMDNFRPIIIPFGPKIFALVSMFCNVSLRPKVGVWRVSSGDWSAPQDRIASGEVTKIGVIFGP